MYLFLQFLRKKDTSYVMIISPIQSLSSTPGVWCRALDDASHTHNTFRVADILPSCKGILCDYMDRAWWLKYWSASRCGNSIIILLVCPLVALLHHNLQCLFLSFWCIVVFLQKPFNHHAHLCTGRFSFIPVNRSVLTQLFCQVFG